MEIGALLSGEGEWAPDSSRQRMNRQAGLPRKLYVDPLSAIEGVVRCE